MITSFTRILLATFLFLMATMKSNGISLYGFAVDAFQEEKYEESLKLKSLPNGHLFAHFEFTTTISKLSNYTRLFPRTLAEILDTHDVHELHLSLTQGYWRIESWGEAQLKLPSTVAPSGAFVSAWFTANNQKDADSNWRGLTNRLSGLSCASLNFLDSKTSIEPVFAYKPQGKLPALKKPLFARVGSLPKEHTCTENFTPWTKLLPCGISRGMASLLRSKKIFSTLYHSSGIHVLHTGHDGEIKLVQSLSLVYDLPSGYVKSDNLARKIVGSLGLFPCQPASKTTLEIWKDNNWVEIDSNKINTLVLGDIPEAKETDVQFVFTPTKFMGGFGQEYGEMIIEMTNHLTDEPLHVLYVEVLPWYVRPYFHTMQIVVNKDGERQHSIEPGQQFHYTPGRNRELLHKLEMDLTIPPKSTATLTFTVEKGFLKWDEYPPDANHGFYLESSHFELNYTSKPNPDENNNIIQYYYTRKLLVDLSTPDFSMPYNVICLTCTVVALAFGPIHNITTRRLCLVPVVSNKDKLKKLVNKLLRRNIFKIEETEKLEESKVSNENNEDESSKVVNSEEINNAEK